MTRASISGVEVAEALGDGLDGLVVDAGRREQLLGGRDVARLHRADERGRGRHQLGRFGLDVLAVVGDRGRHGRARPRRWWSTTDVPLTTTSPFDALEPFGQSVWYVPGCRVTLNDPESPGVRFSDSPTMRPPCCSSISVTASAPSFVMWKVVGPDAQLEVRGIAAGVGQLELHLLHVGVGGGTAGLAR